MAVALKQSLAGQTFTTAGSSMDYPIAAGVSTGDLVVLWIGFDNLTMYDPSVVSITVPAGETAAWVKIGAHDSNNAGLNAGNRGEMWGIRATKSWGATTATVTLSASTAKKAIVGSVFSGAPILSVRTSGWDGAGNGAPNAISEAEVLEGDLVLGGATFESNLMPEGDSDGTWDAGNGTFTAGGTAATGVAVMLQYKIATVDGYQFYRPLGTLDSGAVVAGLNVAVKTWTVNKTDDTGRTDSVEPLIFTPPPPVLWEEDYRDNVGPYDTSNLVQPWDKFSTDYDNDGIPDGWKIFQGSSVFQKSLEIDPDDGAVVWRMFMPSSSVFVDTIAQWPASPWGEFSWRVTYKLEGVTGTVSLILVSWLRYGKGSGGSPYFRPEYTTIPGNTGGYVDITGTTSIPYGGWPPDQLIDAVSIGFTIQTSGSVPTTLWVKQVLLVPGAQPPGRMPELASTHQAEMLYGNTTFVDITDDVGLSETTDLFKVRTLFFSSPIRPSDSTNMMLPYEYFLGGSPSYPWQSQGNVSGFLITNPIDGPEGTRSQGLVNTGASESGIYYSFYNTEAYPGMEMGWRVRYRTVGTNSAQFGVTFRSLSFQTIARIRVTLPPSPPGEYTEFAGTFADLTTVTQGDPNDPAVAYYRPEFWCPPGYEFYLKRVMLVYGPTAPTTFPTQKWTGEIVGGNPPPSWSDNTSMTDSATFAVIQGGTSFDSVGLSDIISTQVVPGLTYSAPTYGMNITDSATWSLAPTYPYDLGTDNRNPTDRISAISMAYSIQITDTRSGTDSITWAPFTPQITTGLRDDNVRTDSVDILLTHVIPSFTDLRYPTDSVTWEPFVPQFTLDLADVRSADPTDRLILGINTGATDIRGVTDSVSAETFNPQLTYNAPVDLRNPTDSISVVKTTTWVVDTVDALGLVDTRSTSSFTPQTTFEIGEAPYLTDSISTIADMVREVADSFGPAETVSTALTGALLDSVGLTDSVSTEMVAGQNINATDPIGLTDSVSTTLNIQKVFDGTNPVGLTDSVSTSLAKFWTVNATDAIRPSDYNNTTALIPPQVFNFADAVRPTDSVTVILAKFWSVTAVDSSGLTDSVSTTLIPPPAAGVSDVLGMTDTVSHALLIPLVIDLTDAYILTDTLLRAVDLSRSDTVGLQDTKSIDAVFPPAEYPEMWDGITWVRHPVMVWTGSTWELRPISAWVDPAWRESVP